MSLGEQAKGVGWEKGKNGKMPRLVLLETRSKCLPKRLGTSENATQSELKLFSLILAKGTLF